MHITIVYELATDDYTWLYSFYPVRRFIEAGKYCNCTITVLLARDVLKSGISLIPCHSFVLIRGSVSHRIFDLLEEADIPYCNSRSSHEKADNKKTMYAFFAENGFPFPKVYSYTEIQSFCDYDFPLIVKPTFGSQGRAVHLLKNKDALCCFLHMGICFDDWIFQEYIAYTGSRDIRIFFCNGAVLATVERCGSGLTSNVHQNEYNTVQTRIRPISVAPLYINMALDIACKSGLFYGTVDFLHVTETELTVCEINASPGFEGIEKQTGSRIAERIIQELT